MVMKRFPPLEPYKTGFLPVSKMHTLYWEECGNPHGKPVVFLHGGPGSGIEASHRCYFHPSDYRIILFDQRGCGKSRPFAELKENTTWDLVQDIEKLREHLGVDRWVVFGGSWGSTLALCYAIKHPDRVKGLIIRGVFLCRKVELSWFYQSGTNFIFPDEWEKFVLPIPLAERNDMIRAYYKRLTSTDSQVRTKAAQSWASWEGATLFLRFNSDTFQSFVQPAHAEAVSRIEAHYFVNNIFFETDNWILENVKAIRQIPGWIVHGRYDVICPLDSAWALHKAWPEAKLHIIPDAGHAVSEPGVTDALIRATEAFKTL